MTGRGQMQDEVCLSDPIYYGGTLSKEDRDYLSSYSPPTIIAIVYIRQK